MTDFATARRMMVDGQVRTSDVTDARIIAAMLELPRERMETLVALVRDLTRGRGAVLREAPPGRIADNGRASG